MENIIIIHIADITNSPANDLFVIELCICSDFTSKENAVALNQRLTSHTEGKVNRGLVDSEGHAVCVSMPENQARVHKIDGSDGALIWSVTFTDRVGFGICPRAPSFHGLYLKMGAKFASDQSSSTSED